MKKITNSVYTFEDLIKDGFLYVDKTEYIWNLVGQGKGMYFLSRPRRFGKSLTVSTLMAIFEGKKELFKGLAIYDKPYDWKPYPVIHLDMGNCSAKTPEELKLYLTRKLERQCREHQVRIKIRKEALSSSFEDFIDEVAGKGQIVLLLDEYDKPILNTLTSPEAAECRDVLKGFYSTIKVCENKERFVFVTGVSKFCHVSLFSDLNNLTDISMDYDYATMFGYTQAELEKYFADRIDLACEHLKLSREELLAEIAAWYDGYRFHAEAESVYNPVSLARFFSKRCEFDNYWFDVGTPSFLMELIRKKDFNLERTLNEPVTGLAFKAFEIDRIDPLALFLQTGYLTIKRAYTELGETLYELDFPNREVKGAFETYLISDYTAIPQGTVGANVLSMAKAIKAHDIEQFMELLKTFFASVKYDVNVDTEGRFQLLFYSVFLLIGVRVEAEAHTNKGSIDAGICDGDQVFLFEFKLDKTAGSAPRQIQDKEYYQKYLHAGKKIVLVGANFDSTSRQINDWKIEELAEN